MSEPLPFADNSITSFLYEPFSYTIPNPNADVYTLSITRTSGLPASYLSNFGSNVVFETPSNLMVPGTQSFTITATGGGSTLTSTNTVSTSVGRFVDSNGDSFVGSNYTFFAKEAITPIKMTASFSMIRPSSTPTLPPGVFFSAVDGSSVFLTGTPTLPSPQSNYLIISRAVGSSRTVSSTIGMIVSNERVQTTVTPDSSISNMFIGVGITPRVITSRANGVVRYTFPTFPDGIVVTDLSGAVQPISSFGFTPTDPSYTMIIQGTPTLAAATSFKNAGFSNGVTQSIVVQRTDPLPQITSSIPIRFAFGETVLFDAVTVPPLYTNVALDPTAIFVRAATYFTGIVPIISIVAPTLRPDLSLTFNGVDRAFLTGTPTSAGSASVAITATNFSGAARTLVLPITITTDTVVFSPRVDTSYTFVLSRPLDLSLNGYYPTPITFTAAAQSGRLLNWSAPELAGTGLTLSATSGSVVSIVGTPTAITPSRTLTVTATATGTLATASQSVTISVIDDVFTFASVGLLRFIQNRPITPVQISASTLSGRQVNTYSATDLPLGLSISSTGVVSGTPLVSTGTTFRVTGSTGFTTGGVDIAYTTEPDSILLIERPSPAYALTLGGPIPPATVSGLSYSGIVVSNFVFNNLPITYGMTINPTTGVFGGTLTTSVEPDPVIVSNVSFGVSGTAGSFTASLPAQLNTSNAPRYQWYLLRGTQINRAESNFSNWTSIATSPLPNFTDHIVRPVSVTQRVIVGVTGTLQVVQSPDGTTFSNYTVPYEQPIDMDEDGNASINDIPNIGIIKIASVPFTSTIYGIGSNRSSLGGQGTGAFFKSVNDGVSWSVTFPLTADGVFNSGTPSNAVFRSGTIAYKNDVLLVGMGANETAVIRSVDGGTNWAITSPSGVFYTSSFNTDADRWIMAGSSVYYPANGSDPPRTWDGTVANTLRYSDDQGETWTPVASGGFNYFADFVVYSDGVWIAGGRQGGEGSGDDVFFRLRTSTNGTNWTPFTLRVAPFLKTEPLGAENDFLDSINYDGENYNVVVTNNDVGSYTTDVYQHAADGSSLLTGWTKTDTDLTSGPSTEGERTSRLLGRFPVALAPPTPILFFPNQDGGPTITSPVSSSFLLFQYVPMPPIVFTASGSGTTYFFVLESELPDGIRFNSVTNTLSGTPAQTGQTTITFYAKDNVGATTFTISLRVILASITRQQDSAGAYTSLVRQYTEVNAAVTARDSKATPSNEYRLGEFTSPVPPSVVTDSNCPKC